MSHRLYKNKCQFTNVADLNTQVVNVWDETEDSVLSSSNACMPNRISEVLKAGGGRAR